ncbi:VOC family protein [Steroidobacter agaridevorans]|uniref:VOC family protein n=1 Tax=Steroidobacter agaridevorans TaxID=2695856 RepID=UPI001329089D|nr:VOC family protein [Steroidobacter agaridevorans]GFE90804.1 glyoxalase [Steroidobacter agaridevorans]
MTVSDDCGLAMVKGTSHVGISVSDLDATLGFYRDAFEMQTVAEIAFDETTENGRYEQILGIKGARGRAVLLRVGSMQVELFEFSHPAPKRADPSRPVSDHGISHFCIEVSDIEMHCARLQAAGATFHCSPLVFFGRSKATYLRDPEGNVIELYEKIAAVEAD